MGNIMKPNRPKNTVEVQENYEMINTWIRHNTETIKPLQTINLNNLQKSSTLTTPITLIEITETLKKIKSKATCPLEITKEILKQTPRKTGLQLARLYNATLATGHFPQILKHTNIILLPKQNKNPTSDRPIARLNILSKIHHKYKNPRSYNRQQHYTKTTH